MFDLGGFDKLLQITNDEGGSGRLSPRVNDALRATGSSYQVPEGADQQPSAQLPEGTGQALDLLSGGARMPKGLQKLDSSPVAGLAKKAASAVAAYYTGGLSALATNVGGQVLSQRNPRAGALLGAATKLYGG
jgi:hypothetical protein